MDFQLRLKFLPEIRGSRGILITMMLIVITIKLLSSKACDNNNDDSDVDCNGNAEDIDDTDNSISDGGEDIGGNINSISLFNFVSIYIIVETNLAFPNSTKC